MHKQKRVDNIIVNGGKGVKSRGVKSDGKSRSVSTGFTHV